MNNPHRLLHLEWQPFAALDRSDEPTPTVHRDTAEALLGEIRALERNCHRLENELARARAERDATLSRLRQLQRKFEEEG